MQFFRCQMWNVLSLPFVSISSLLTPMTTNSWIVLSRQEPPTLSATTGILRSWNATISLKWMYAPSLSSCTSSGRFDAAFSPENLCAEGNKLCIRGKLYILGGLGVLQFPIFGGFRGGDGGETEGVRGKFLCFCEFFLRE